MKNFRSLAAHGWLPLALVLGIFAIIGFVSCPQSSNDDDGGKSDEIEWVWNDELEKPICEEVYVEIGQNGKAVFTLRNPEDFPATTKFLVYAMDIGVTVHETVTAARSGNKITLSSSTGEVEGGTYWLAAIPYNGLVEGERGPFMVAGLDYFDHPYKGEAESVLKFTWPGFDTSLSFPTTDANVTVNIPARLENLIRNAPVIEDSTDEAFFSMVIGGTGTATGTVTAGSVTENFSTGTATVSINGVTGRIVDLPLSLLEAALENQNKFSYEVNTPGDYPVLGLWFYYPYTGHRRPYEGDPNWELVYTHTANYPLSGGGNGTNFNTGTLRGKDNKTLRELLQAAPEGSAWVSFIYDPEDWLGNGWGVIQTNSGGDVPNNSIFVPLDAERMTIYSTTGWVVVTDPKVLLAATASNDTFRYRLWDANRKMHGFWLFYNRDPNYVPFSQPPAVTNAKVQKSTVTQPTVTFTLTAAATGTLRVYGTERGSDISEFVTVSSSGTTLTLTAKDGINVPKGLYFISQQNTDERESQNRLQLTVDNPFVLTDGPYGDDPNWELKFAWRGAESDDNLSYFPRGGGDIKFDFRPSAATGRPDGTGLLPLQSTSILVPVIKTSISSGVVCRFYNGNGGGTPVPVTYDSKGTWEVDGEEGHIFHVDPSLLTLSFGGVFDLYFNADDTAAQILGLWLYSPK